MFPILNRRTTSLALVLAVGGTLSAQVTTGALSGKVTDASGKALAKARVTIESPALFRPRVAVTDERGEWRVGLLPPGDYKVLFLAEDHITQSQELRLGVGRNEAVNARLKPIQDSAGATVAVVDGVVSVAEAKAGNKVSANFTGEQLEAVPYSSRPDMLYTYVPGTRSDNLTIRGADIRTGMRYLVDGIDVRDEYSGNGILSPVMDSVEDIQLVLSAVNARNGRSLGSQFVVVTKRGSNEFQGSLRGRYQRANWATDAGTATSFSLGQDGDDASLQRWEYTVSGPILKDRIWFAVSGSHSPATSFSRQHGFWDETFGGSIAQLGPVLTRNTAYANTDAVLHAGLPGYSLDIPTQPTPYPQMIQTGQWDVHLSGLISTNHMLEARFGKNKTDYKPSSGIESPQAGMQTSNINHDSNWALNYQATLAANVMLEATLSSVKRESGDEIGRVNGARTPLMVNLQSADASRNYPLYSQNTQVFPGPGFNMMRNSASGQLQTHANKNFEVNLRAFVDFFGLHELDFGGESYSAIYNPGNSYGDDNQQVYAGGYLRNGADYRFPTVVWEPTVNKITGSVFNWGVAPVLLQSWASAADQVNTARAFWLNDNWSATPSLNITLGLRFNAVKMKNQDGSTIQKDSNLEPRFQVRWDPGRDGKNIYSLAFTRSNASFDSRLSSRLVTNPANYYTVRGWKGDGTQPALSTLGASTDGGLYGVRWVSYDQLIDHSNYTTVPFVFVNNAVTNRADNLKTPYADQIELSYHHRFVDGGTFRISAIDKRFKREVFSYSDYSWDFLVLSKDPSGQNGGTPRWLYATQWANSPFTRVYQSVEMSLQDHISSRLFWNLSWTYTHERVKDQAGRLNMASVRTSPNNPIPASDYLADGITRHDHVINSFLTYMRPVGKGSLNFTLAGTYTTALPASLMGTDVFTMPTGGPTQNDPVHNPNNYAIQAAPSGMNRVPVYYGGFGQYKLGTDVFRLDLAINWNLPLGFRKLALLGSLGVNDLLHNSYSLAGHGNNRPLMNPLTNGYPTGGVFGNFSPGGQPRAGWGQASGFPGSYSAFNYSSIGRVTNVSMGLRF
jgi:hypothetical protein